MSVRSFHSVFMATAVAGAALGCYLVSLRVASERAALEAVEHQIAQTHRDIRLLQTEIGTRARLAQLERWNVKVLALSAPGADQILGDKFQLARLVRPEDKAVDAPIVLAAAPAPEPQQPFANEPAQASSPAPQRLLYEASVKLPVRAEMPAKRAAAEPVKPAPVEVAKRTFSTIAQPAVKQAAIALKKKSGDKNAKVAGAEVTAAMGVAKVDPLAPLPGGSPQSKALRTQR